MVDSTSPPITVGVLALQGDVVEHVRSIVASGATAVEVRTRSDLEGVSGLVIPGGESTTVGKLLERFNLLEPLQQRIAGGMPVYGTCTGMILLAKSVEDGLDGQPILGSLDVVVARNGYGRQLESFEATVDLSLPAQEPGSFHGVFIRAPRVRSVGPGVGVLARMGHEIVAVCQGNLLATSFHPELTSDARVHAYFVGMCRAFAAISNPGPDSADVTVPAESEPAP